MPGHCMLPMHCSDLLLLLPKFCIAPLQVVPLVLTTMRPAVAGEPTAAVAAAAGAYIMLCGSCYEQRAGWQGVWV